jgi:hypothetical protein
MIDEQRCFRETLNDFIESYPELFPAEIKDGYQLYGFARRQNTADRLPTEAGGIEVYNVVPSFVLPYRVGYSEDVVKALFLRRFGVPYWGLTYVFGLDDMYWQRLVCLFGRNAIVGTTLKDAKHLPDYVLADEKHTRMNGEKAYIVTTVAAGCILGAVPKSGSR